MADFLKQHKGYNCSQQMALMLIENAEENQQLLDAFGALGVGLYCRKVCGVLSGAVCAMAAALHGDPAHRDLQQDLVAWFEERYASTECEDLLGNQNCTQIVDETAEQCKIMLESYLQDTFE